MIASILVLSKVMYCENKLKINKYSKSLLKITFDFCKYHSLYYEMISVWFVFRISLNTMTLNVESPRVYTRHGVPISVTGIAQVRQPMFRW